MAALAGVIDAVRGEEPDAAEKLQHIEKVFSERGGMEKLRADCEAVQAWSNNNYFPLLTPSFDYLRQISLNCPIPVIWSAVPVHVVQHSGKWSTVPVTPKNWTTSHRNRGPPHAGISGPIAPESAHPYEPLKRPFRSMEKNRAINDARAYINRNYDTWIRRRN